MRPRGVVAAIHFDAVRWYLLATICPHYPPFARPCGWACWTPDGKEAWERVGRRRVNSIPKFWRKSVLQYGLDLLSAMAERGPIDRFEHANRMHGAWRIALQPTYSQAEHCTCCAR